MRGMNKLVFKKNISFNILEKIKEYYLFQYLRKKANKHLKEGRKQLIIFSFDYIGTEINVNGYFEKNELDTLIDFLQPLHEDFFKMEMLDVGANIGNHSVFFSSYFKSVQAFEPNPRVFQVLKLNAALVDNVVTNNVGLGSERKKVSLGFSRNNIGEAKVIDQNELIKDEKKIIIDINIERIDDYIKKYNNIRMIKIDVEDYELEVLRGARKLIEASRPVIIFEQHESAFTGGRSEFIESLRIMGYKFFVIEKKNSGGSGFLLIANLIRKMSSGMQMEVKQRHEVLPGNYSMIIAASEQDAEKLVARGR